MRERGTFVCWETWVGSLVQLQELHSTLCQPIGDEMDNQLAGSESCYPLYGYNYRRNQFVICLQKMCQHKIVIFPIVANIITSHGKELAEICQVFLWGGGFVLYLAIVNTAVFLHLVSATGAMDLKILAITVDSLDSHRQPPASTRHSWTQSPGIKGQSHQIVHISYWPG